MNSLFVCLLRGLLPADFLRSEPENTPKRQKMLPLAKKMYLAALCSRRLLRNSLHLATGNRLTAF